MRDTTNNTNNDLSSSLVRELLKEKRADRRWKNIRFIFWFAFIGFLFFTIFKHSGTTFSEGSGNRYVALVRINGMIAPGREFSAEQLVPVLQDAFSDKKAQGVILDINSPGGTPVQAAIIHDAILAFKKKYKKKVVVVGEDLLTSGAYYLAVAGDLIYVNQNTLTGSIGVIMKGFGFVDLMKKIGVERRVYIAGHDKDRLDPFLPQTEEDRKKVDEVMTEIHQNFEQVVISGRKGKLRADANVLFTGDFWSGQTALKLGLVDKMGNLLDAMQVEFNVTAYKEYGSTPGLLRALTSQISTSFDNLFYSVR